MDVNFNVCKVKFDLLNDLTKEIFQSQPIRTVNIFINLDDLYHRFKYSTVNQEFQACGAAASKMLVSNTLNLMGHYRQWAVRRGVVTKVYGYLTKAIKGFENRIYVPNYRQHYAERCNLGVADAFYVNQAIIAGTPILSTTTNYIDGVYFIDSGLLEPSCVPYLIQTKFNTADWNFIVTRDEYDFQYVNYDRFSIIYPVHSGRSELLTSNNIWRHIANKEKIECPNADKYPAELLGWALAVIGNKKRSIEKIRRISWRTLFSIIDEIAESNNDFSYVTLKTKFAEKICTRISVINAFNDNVSATDIRESVKVIGDICENYIKQQLQDIPDYDNLNELNRSPQLFASCPLNLQFLTDEGSSSRNPFN